MLVVDTGSGTAMAGLAVTETPHLRVTTDDWCRDFIVLALEIARIRDSGKTITGI
jgi:hypothetical protein